MNEKHWGSWQHPEAPAEEVAKLFSFLKLWYMRFLPTAQEAIAGFKEAYRKNYPLLKAIAGEKLLSVNFESRLFQDMTCSQIISRLLDKIAFCFGDNKLQSTAASKILHTIKPDLFVMWDSDIIGSYRSA